MYALYWLRGLRFREGIIHRISKTSSFPVNFRRQSTEAKWYDSLIYIFFVIVIFRRTKRRGYNVKNYERLVRADEGVAGEALPHSPWAYYSCKIYIIFRILTIKFELMRTLNLLHSQQFIFLGWKKILPDHSLFYLNKSFISFFNNIFSSFPF